MSVGLGFHFWASSELSRVLPSRFHLGSLPLKVLFVKLKDCTPRDEKSSVYKLDCVDYQGIYIGETGRQLKIGVAEHVKS